MFKGALAFLSIVFLLQNGFSQNVVEEIEEEKFNEVLTFFISINFSNETKSNVSAFYYDDLGFYYVKSSRILDQDDIITSLISEVNRFETYELISELKILI